MDDKQKDFERLNSFFKKIVDSINDSSPKVFQQFRSLLVCIMFDFNMRLFIPQLKNNDNNCRISQRDFDSYLIHIKRSFIMEAWAITENRFAEIVNEERLTPIKTSLQSAKERIESAIKIIRSSRARKLLKEAKNKIPSKLNDFRAIRGVVLDQKINDENQKNELSNFLETLCALRNSSHSNFISSISQKIYNNKWYEQNFELGKPLNLYAKDIEEISNGLLLLFGYLDPPMA